jgi:hypothetical protein
MAVSAVGQGVRLSTIKYVVATVLVFLGMFTYFYGPPLSPNLSQAARETCNRMTGGDSRTFLLEWRTTTYDSVDAPHWVCYDLGEPGHPGTSLGWWAGF